MKKSVWWRFAFLLVVAAICMMTTACGMIAIHAMNNTYESLAGTRKDVAYSGSGFKKIIVVGLVENDSTRIAYENTFMNQLIGARVNAVISSIDLPDADSLKDKSLVERVIRNGSCDGVITVAVKNIAADEPPQWLKTWVATLVPGRDNLFEVLANADKSLPVAAEKIRFEVVLWDGKTARQVWVGTTTAVDKHWISMEAYPAAYSTVKTLIKAKPLRSTL